MPHSLRYSSAFVSLILLFAVLLIAIPQKAHATHDTCGRFNFICRMVAERVHENQLRELERSVRQNSVPLQFPGSSGTFTEDSEAGIRATSVQVERSIPSRTSPAQTVRLGAPSDETTNIRSNKTNPYIDNTRRSPRSPAPQPVRTTAEPERLGYTEEQLQRFQAQQPAYGVGQRASSDARSPLQGPDYNAQMEGCWTNPNPVSRQACQDAVISRAWGTDTAASNVQRVSTQVTPVDNELNEVGAAIRNARQQSYYDTVDGEDAEAGALLRGSLRAQFQTECSEVSWWQSLRGLSPDETAIANCVRTREAEIGLGDYYAQTSREQFYGEFRNNARNSTFETRSVSPQDISSPYPADAEAFQPLPEQDSSGLFSGIRNFSTGSSRLNSRRQVQDQPYIDPRGAAYDPNSPFPSSVNETDPLGGGYAAESNESPWTWISSRWNNVFGGRDEQPADTYRAEREYAGGTYEGVPLNAYNDDEFYPASLDAPEPFYNPNREYPDGTYNGVPLDADLEPDLTPVQYEDLPAPSGYYEPWQPEEYSLEESTYEPTPWDQRVEVFYEGEDTSETWWTNVQDAICFWCDASIEPERKFAFPFSPELYNQSLVAGAFGAFLLKDK